MMRKLFYGFGLLMLLTACSSQNTDEYHANINKGMEAVAEDNYGKAEAHFEMAAEMKTDDKAAEIYLQQVVLIQQADKEFGEEDEQVAIDTLDRVIEYEEGSRIIATKAKERKEIFLAKQENDSNRTIHETALSEAKNLTEAKQYGESIQKIDALLAGDLNAFTDIKQAAETLKEENTAAQKEAETAAIQKAEQEKKAAQKKVAEQQAASDPYEWAPGVKAEFQRRVAEAEYVDSIDTLRYEKAHLFNGQGHYEVYGQWDGVEFRILTVNAKTGDYTGL